MRKSVSQIMFSVCLLVIGVVLLLVNIGVISLEIKQLFVGIYPFLLLIYGVVSLFSILIRKSNNIFFTLFIITFSTLLVLDRLNILVFQFMDFWKLWPLIIILMAFKLLLRKSKFSVSFEFDTKKKKEILPDSVVRINKKKVVSKAFKIGDVKLNSDNWAVEPMKLHNSIGDYFIDFSKAYIPEKETVMEVSGWIGSIKIIIPDDLPVYISGEVQVGDIQIFEDSDEGIGNRLEFKSLDYDEAVRKVKLHIFMKIGDINVQRV